MESREVVKRVMDLVLCILALPFAMPIVGVMALAIVLESRGSPFFLQTRVGRRGRLFTVFKLRTMVQDAEHLGAGIFFAENDPRFTKCGLFARRFSLDEVPQLWNVFKGEMSVVGPRPMLPVTVEEYLQDYNIILEVRPGLTGLAQVSGRNALPRSQRLALDRMYAQTWTPLTDLWIVFRTVSVVLTGRGQLNNQGRMDVEA